MKSKKVQIVIGINKGYYYDNNTKRKFTIEDMCRLWQEKALKIFEEKNIYVSAVINKSIVAYNTDWGCPTSGEDTFTIVSSANPNFIKDLDLWKKCVVETVQLLKEDLQQTTVSLDFQDIDFLYLN